MADTVRSGAVLMIMGAAGAGKTVVGRRLAAGLGFDFIEGDAFHPPANVAKMQAGIPLDDADRAPWLDALRFVLLDTVAAQRSAVVACSCLRRRYRERLLAGLPAVAVVYLETTPDVLRERLERRAGHYMPAELVPSQLETLEPPQAIPPEELLTFGMWTDRALFIDAARPVEEIVAAVLARLVPDSGREGQ